MEMTHDENLALAMLDSRGRQDLFLGHQLAVAIEFAACRGYYVGADSLFWLTESY